MPKFMGIITLLKVKATKSFFHVTSVDFNKFADGGLYERGDCYNHRNGENS
jgi:hypothetical protein